MVTSVGIRRPDENIAATATVFDNIVAIAGPAAFNGKHFDNFVVAGLDVRFPVKAIERRVSKFLLPTKFFDGGALCSRVASVRSLTDSSAGWPKVASPRQGRPHPGPRMSVNE